MRRAAVATLLFGLTAAAPAAQVAQAPVQAAQATQATQATKAPAPKAAAPTVDPVAELEKRLETATENSLSRSQARYRAAVDTMRDASDRAEGVARDARQSRTAAQERLRAVARKAADAVHQKRQELTERFDDLLVEADKAARGTNTTQAKQALAKLEDASDELDKVSDEQLAELRKGARADLHQVRRSAREMRRRADDILHRLMHSEVRIGDLAESAASHTQVKESALEKVAERQADSVEALTKASVHAAEKAMDDQEADLEDQADKLETSLKQEFRRDEHERHQKVSAVAAAVHGHAAGAQAAMAVAPFNVGSAALFAAVGSCAALAGFAVAKRSRRSPLSEGLLPH
uniref:Uncharacterized protein n=1 Tax=Strombidinopsis acuminata TaxID=141414 RepID=A0A7S3S4B3_9SPIT